MTEEEEKEEKERGKRERKREEKEEEDDGKDTHYDGSYDRHRMQTPNLTIHYKMPKYFFHDWKYRHVPRPVRPGHVLQ